MTIIAKLLISDKDDFDVRFEAQFPSFICTGERHQISLHYFQKEKNRTNLKGGTYSLRKSVKDLRFQCKINNNRMVLNEKQDIRRLRVHLTAPKKSREPVVQFCTRTRGTYIVATPHLTTAVMTVCCVSGRLALIRRREARLQQLPYQTTGKWNKRRKLQGGSNMTGTNCDLFTHK
jgi:hypothetical protein